MGDVYTPPARKKSLLKSMIGALKRKTSSRGQFDASSSQRTSASTSRTAPRFGPSSSSPLRRRRSEGMERLVDEDICSDDDEDSVRFRSSSSEYMTSDSQFGSPVSDTSLSPAVRPSANPPLPPPIPTVSGATSSHTPPPPRQAADADAEESSTPRESEVEEREGEDSSSHGHSSDGEVEVSRPALQEAGRSSSANPLVSQTARELEQAMDRMSLQLYLEENGRGRTSRPRRSDRRASEGREGTSMFTHRPRRTRVASPREQSGHRSSFLDRLKFWRRRNSPLSNGRNHSGRFVHHGQSDEQLSGSSSSHNPRGLRSRSRSMSSTASSVDMHRRAHTPRSGSNHVRSGERDGFNPFFLYFPELGEQTLRGDVGTRRARMIDLVTGWEGQRGPATTRERRRGRRGQSDETRQGSSSPRRLSGGESRATPAGDQMLMVGSPGSTPPGGARQVGMLVQASGRNGNQRMLFVGDPNITGGGPGRAVQFQLRDGTRRSVGNMQYEDLVRLLRGLDLVGAAGQRSVSRAALSRLPTYPCPAKMPEHNKQCTICLTDFEEGVSIRALPCLHSFHTQCIDRWLSSSIECPMCKHRITQAGDEFS